MIPKKIIEYSYSDALRLREPCSCQFLNFLILSNLAFQSKLDQLLVFQINTMISKL